MEIAKVLDACCPGVNAMGFACWADGIHMMSEMLEVRCPDFKENKSKWWSIACAYQRRDHYAFPERIDPEVYR